MIQKKVWAIFIVALMVVGSLLLTNGAASAGDTYNWKGQSCFGLSSPLGRYTIVIWKKMVEEMSGGRIKITLHDAGEIVPPNKIYDAVKTGLLDFGLNTPAWQKGQKAAGELFYTLPAGILEFNDLILWLYGGGGLALEQELYGNELYVFPLGLSPPEEIWSKREIKTLDDIKGLKIRAAGLSMDLWQELGASVVQLSGGEVLPSLQRGLIDATEFLDASYDYSAGFHEVCKYRFGPPIHMSNNIFQLLVKTKSYEALPDDLKAIVKTAAMAATFQGYAEFWQETIEANKKIEEYGTITIKLSKADQDRAREIALKTINAKAEQDPMFKKVWESQKEFLNKYKPYNNLTKFD